jgi:hypothetical protein
MLRSITRPRLRLAAAGLALCGGLAAASPSLAATAATPPLHLPVPNSTFVSAPPTRSTR